jgi:hypothetical protein
VGVLVNERARGSKPGDDGEERVVEADIIVLATGFEKPDIGFLEEGLFPEGYEVRKYTLWWVSGCIDCTYFEFRVVEAEPVSAEFLD